MNKQKKFYYTGKTYQNATYTEEYSRVSRWIKIDYTIPRSEEAESRPFFRHGNRRYYLDNFIRCGSAWIAPLQIESKDGEKIDLAGQESDNYYKPLFIEIDAGGEAVRVYQYNGSETDYA